MNWKIVAPVAYMGKKDCTNPRCRNALNEDGTSKYGSCMGYHCSYCDEPCSMMGHKCDVSETLIAAAQRESEGE